MRSEFSYARPDTLDEVLDILARYGEKARLIAGGTDLMIAIREGTVDAELVVDIGRIDELQSVRQEDGRIAVGPCTTHAHLATSNLIRTAGPVLSRAASSVGSLQIRNRGTVGGNVINASPGADTIPALVVLGANVTLSRQDATRTLSITDLFTGPYETVIEPQEVLSEITFDDLGDVWRSSFIKLVRRKALAVSRINIAVVARMDDARIGDVRISVGSSTPTPCRFAKAEAALRGEVPSRQLINEAALLVAAEMIERTGTRPSTVYKKPAVQGLFKKALDEIVPTTGV
jgi:CO/xanthine dehydrogenase FAD-binding subunit